MAGPILSRHPERALHGVAESRKRAVQIRPVIVQILVMQSAHSRLNARLQHVASEPRGEALAESSRALTPFVRGITKRADARTGGGLRHHTAIHHAFHTRYFPPHRGW